MTVQLPETIKGMHIVTLLEVLTQAVKEMQVTIVEVEQRIVALEKEKNERAMR